MLLFKKLAFITIALLVSHTLKASSTEEEREKLLNFSSNGKLRLARLAINHHCSIDQLLDEFENGGDNGDLQLDVNGFLGILGNIGDVGDSLTIRGQKLKDLIDQNVNTDTIFLALNNVRGELGGNGDLLTRAEALQGIIDDARIKINDASPSLPAAVTQLEGLVVPAAGSNIYLRTQEIIDERDTALDIIEDARIKINGAAASLPAAVTQLEGLVVPAAGSNIYLRTQEIIDERDTALDIIEDARIKINDAAASLPAAVTQLEGLVVPAPPSNNIYLRTQEIMDERDTALDIIEDARIKINDAAASLPAAVTQLEGLVVPAPPSNNIYLRTQEIMDECAPSVQAIEAMLQEVNDNIAGTHRVTGTFPVKPTGGFQTIPQLVNYVTITNLNAP